MKRRACTLLMITFFALVAAIEHDAEWKLWKHRHRKQYSSYENEWLSRAVWLKNKKYIEDHNAQANQSGYSLEINSFGDMVGIRRLLHVLQT